MTGPRLSCLTLERNPVPPPLQQRGVDIFGHP
jgi:hypothetical protein